MWTIAAVISVFFYGTMKHRAWILSPSTGRHRARGLTFPYVHTGTHRHNRDSLSSVRDLVGHGRVR